MKHDRRVMETSD